jgi:hypothetical protein
MAISDQSILDGIDAAILAILTNQVESMSESNRAATMLQLDKLQSMKREYERRIQIANAPGGMIANVQFGRPQ